MIHPDRLLAESFIRQVEWLPEAGSTNTVALQAANNGYHLPCLFGTDRQLQGRGRNHHTWWAGPGALTFSILLQPDTFSIPAHKWPLLSLVTGLAICRALEEFLPQSHVQWKWPNDVYVNSRKICGILIETTPVHPELLIIGIGINVNNSLGQAPEEVRQKATSMADQTSRIFNRTDVLVSVLQALELEFNALSQSDPTQLNRCRERCFLTGRMLNVCDVNVNATGMCLGIDDDGALRLMTEIGPRRFLSGEITRFE